MRGSQFPLEIGLLRFILFILTFYPQVFLKANEAEAVYLEREARRLENLSSNTSKKSLKDEYLLIAERRRESAFLERQRHFFKPSYPIQDTKVIREIDKTLPLPKNRLSDGVWEVSLGFGSGNMDISPGGMYIQDPILASFLRTDFVPRGGIGYDNIFTFDSRESPRLYSIHPIYFKINYYDSSLRYGFGIQERSLHKNVSYNAWDASLPGRRINAIHHGEFSWKESKFNIFYKENWSYDKTLTLVWGLRYQTTNLSEKASLPLFPATFEYNENSFSLAPNLGIAYTQNFFGFFLFTVGAELSIGQGGLSFNRRFNRGLRGDIPPSFSYLRMENPIPMSIFGGEFYTKYDFIINEKNRLGVSWTYHQFSRQTNQTHFPLIITSNPIQLENEYQRVFARTLIYNDESNRPGNQRYQILRFLQLEYTHVF